MGAAGDAVEGEVVARAAAGGCDMDEDVAAAEALGADVVAAVAQHRAVGGDDLGRGAFAAQGHVQRVVLAHADDEEVVVEGGEVVALLAAEAARGAVGVVVGLEIVVAAGWRRVLAVAAGDREPVGDGGCLAARHAREHARARRRHREIAVAERVVRGRELRGAVGREEREAERGARGRGEADLHVGARGRFHREPVLVAGRGDDVDGGAAAGAEGAAGVVVGLGDVGVAARRIARRRGLCSA